MIGFEIVLTYGSAMRHFRTGADSNG